MWAVELLVLHLGVRPQLFFNGLTSGGEFSGGRAPHEEALDDGSVSFGWSCDHKNLTEAVDDASFIDVVRGHFHFDTVANGEANEAFAHLARDMSENLMLIGQSNPEHRSRENRQDGSFDFNGFF